MMRTTHIDGWAWRIAAPFDLAPWFKDYRTLEKQNRVKANDNRVVFKICVNDRWYYVKHEQPSSTGQKIRSFIRPKAEAEFMSATLLTAAGIPVVEMVGWGKRGCESMLVSRALENAVNARECWFGGAMRDAAMKAPFVAGLAKFIRAFVNAAGRHPDLHLGNILAVKTRDAVVFHLVDPYGARVDAAPSDDARVDVWTLAGALRNGLDFDEAAAFLIAAGLARDSRAAKALWRSIIKNEAEENRRHWPGRREKILAGRNRYCLRSENPDHTVRYVRCSLTGEPLVTPTEVDNLLSLNEKYEIVSLGDAEAEALWLRSFLLQYHLVDHRRPLAWLRTGKDSKVALERLPPSTPFDQTKAADFLERCAESGVLFPDFERQIMMVDGAPLLVDILAAEIR